MADKPVDDVQEVLAHFSSAWKDMMQASTDKARSEQNKFLNDEGFRNELYRKYSGLDTWLVKDEAIPLVLGFSPAAKSLISDKANSRLVQDVEGSKQVSLQVFNGDAKLDKWRVKPRDFVLWTKSKGVKVPESLSCLLSEAKQAKLVKAPGLMVDYSTPLLEVCNHVINEFWENKGINDAPTRDWIVDYLMDKFDLSKNDAQAIDTVTRHPQRKKGGHIKR